MTATLNEAPVLRRVSKPNAPPLERIALLEVKRLQAALQIARGPHRGQQSGAATQLHKQLRRPEFRLRIRR